MTINCKPTICVCLWITILKPPLWHYGQLHLVFFGAPGSSVVTRLVTSVTFLWEVLSFCFCVRVIQCSPLPWLVSTQQWLHFTNVFPPSSPVPCCLAGFQGWKESLLLLCHSTKSSLRWQHVCLQKSSWGLNTFNLFPPDSESLFYSCPRETFNKAESQTSAGTWRPTICGLDGLLAGGGAFIWFVCCVSGFIF